MKKQIDIELIDLDEQDTICGYPVKDLLLAAKVMEKHGITPYMIKEYAGNFRRAYEVLMKDVGHIMKNSYERWGKSIKEENEKRV